MKQYISIDIGGTSIKYGVIDENGNILERRETPTQAEKGGPAILDKVLEVIKAYTTDHKSADEAITREETSDKAVIGGASASNVITGKAIAGVCISTAGMVDTEKGEIFYSAPLIPDYAGTRYKEVIEERFGIACEVENDVNCAGLAESISGAAMGSHSTVMLTIGTGIGGCILIGGRVYHGFSNSACEVGYMTMFDSDFQTLGAASILTKKVAAQKQEAPGSWSGHRIFEEAKKGDAICIRAIDEMTDILGRGIANICYVLNPQTVVLGGGIMAQEEYLEAQIQTAVSRYLIESVACKTKVCFAVHQNDAGLLGAYYHFRERQR